MRSFGTQPNTLDYWVGIEVTRTLLIMFEPGSIQILTATTKENPALRHLTITKKGVTKDVAYSQTMTDRLVVCLRFKPGTTTKLQMARHGNKINKLQLEPTNPLNQWEDFKLVRLIAEIGKFLNLSPAVTD